MRLGHILFSRLGVIQPNIDVTKLSVECICTICPAVRQQRLSFPISTIKTSYNFKFLHVDIWGPFKIPAQIHCNMSLTIVDDFSRSTWGHFLHHKFDYVHILIKFIIFVKNQFNYTVKFIRIDNAKELCECDICLFIMIFAYYIKPIPSTLLNKMG